VVALYCSSATKSGSRLPCMSWTRRQARRSHCRRVEASGSRSGPTAKRAPALPPIKLGGAVSGGGVFADHYRLASAIRAPMIAAAVPGSSDPAPRGPHVRRVGTWLTFDVRRSLPISIIGRCAPRSLTLSDFKRPELVRTTWVAVRDGRTRYYVVVDPVWTSYSNSVD